MFAWASESKTVVDSHVYIEAAMFKSTSFIFSPSLIQEKERHGHICEQLLEKHAWGQRASVHKKGGKENRTSGICHDQLKISLRTSSSQPEHLCFFSDAFHQHCCPGLCPIPQDSCTVQLPLQSVQLPLQSLQLLWLGQHFPLCQKKS